MWFGLDFVLQKNLNNLKYYSYVGIDNSILKRLYLGMFWEWATKMTPLWVAPNTITFLGLLCLMMNAVIAIYYLPMAIDLGDEPRVIYLIFAINIFIYQTLDNVDGKQARRTNSSSPLGELFDHGCDSLFMVLTIIPLIISMRMGVWDGFNLLSVGTIAFYTAHWKAFYCKKYIFGLIANPTEIQVVIMAIFIFSYVFGPSYWQTNLKSLLPYNIGYFHYLEIPISLLFIYSNILCALVVIAFDALEIFKNLSKDKKKLLKSIKLLGIEFVYIALFYFWALFSDQKILETQTISFLILYGFACSLLCDKLLLVKICNTDIFNINYYLYDVFSVPLIGILSALPSLTHIIPESLSIKILTASFLSFYWYYITSVVSLISNYLNIRVFSIKNPTCTMSSI